MDSSKIKYDFSASLWQHQSPGGWYFVSLPQTITQEIRTHLKTQEKPWGRMPVNAQVESTQWQTALWFDTKQNTYILPLKASIRKKLVLKETQVLNVSIFI